MFLNFFIFFFYNCSCLTFQSNDYEYETTSDDTVKVVQSSQSVIMNMQIPSHVENDNITYLVTEIGSGAFKMKMIQGSLVLPESLVIIGSESFYYCYSISGSLIIPNNVIEIGASAFNFCFGLTGSLVIPDSVREIGDSAFYNCGFSGSLTIGNNVTSIGQSAFYFCLSFTGSLVIPDSVISIGSAAFSGCSRINGSLIIGKNITSIGENAFYSLPVEEIIYLGEILISSQIFYEQKAKFVKVNEEYQYEAFGDLPVIRPSDICINSVYYKIDEGNNCAKIFTYDISQSPSILEIPDYVEHNSVQYPVIEIPSYSFYQCPFSCELRIGNIGCPVM